MAYQEFCYLFSSLLYLRAWGLVLVISSWIYINYEFTPLPYFKASNTYSCQI